MMLIRGSYRGAHILLILLNELGKRDQMRGLPNILSLFSNECDKFNNTGAQKLDSIYHMTLQLLKNCNFGVKMSIFPLILLDIIMDVITFPDMYVTMVFRKIQCTIVKS